MQHFHSLEGLELHRSWVTVGMFDGVHRGHQAILAALAKEAHDAGSLAVVVTFYPHPMVVLRNIEQPQYLTSPEERAYLLGTLGIDAVVTLSFDHHLAALSAAEFMKLLCDHLNLQQLWVGSDFALGRNRQGDVQTLRLLGDDLGYKLQVIPDVTLDHARISSSQIRKLIHEGNVAQASRALGRPYTIEGSVIHGDHRGRQLGFPTANLKYWPHKILPPNGVYATWAWINRIESPPGERIPAVSNIGVRPTFQGTEARIEAHLINFDRDLYGKTIYLEFVEFLRPEMRFPSIDALVNQITADRQSAQEILSNETRTPDLFT